MMLGEVFERQLIRERTQSQLSRRAPLERPGAMPLARML
jgi:hypothetical protein